MSRGKPYLVKIIRDKVSNLVPNSTVSYAETPEDKFDEAIEFLRKKLVEEAVEYALKPSMDELADIQETLHALAAYDLGHGTLGILRLQTATRLKREERGGFDKLIGMYITADEPDSK